MKIQHLTLLTNDLIAQQDFYVNLLGFEEIELSKNSLTIQAGKSKLTFVESDSPAYYHFAFNIPSNQIEAALDWLKKRVPVLEFDDKEIIDFPNWNAEAIYFFDNCKNIVEFISRKNLNINSDEKFSVKNILEISEMGLPVNDVLGTFQKLNQDFGLEKYWGDFERFCTLGDEHGLFIVVDENQKLWFPTEIPAKGFPFEMEFVVQEKQYIYK